MTRNISPERIGVRLQLLHPLRSSRVTETRSMWPSRLSKDPEVPLTTHPKPDIRMFIQVRTDYFLVAINSTSSALYIYFALTLLEFAVELELGPHDTSANDIITNPQSGQNFVSIDGKRTYLNLFDSSTPNTGQITPTLIKNYPNSPSGWVSFLSNFEMKFLLCNEGGGG